MKRDVYDRLCLENKDLADKIGKLQGFLNTSAFDELSGIQKDLLRAQCFAMQTYLNILAMRIAVIAEDIT
ncbi:MAG: hypothetical protein V4563_17205 [Pseudomonadota bacterium]